MLSTELANDGKSEAWWGELNNAAGSGLVTVRLAKHIDE